MDSPCCLRYKQFERILILETDGLSSTDVFTYTKPVLERLLFTDFKESLNLKSAPIIRHIDETNPHFTPNDHIHEAAIKAYAQLFKVEALRRMYQRIRAVN